MNEPEYLYRYDYTNYEAASIFGAPRVEVHPESFLIVKRTPKGAWVNTYFGRKFVNLGARKRWACPTREEAMESFIARKERQLSILKAQARNVEAALDRAKEMVSTSTPIGDRGPVEQSIFDNAEFLS